MNTTTSPVPRISRISLGALALTLLATACGPNVANPRWDQVTSRTPAATGGAVASPGAATRLDVAYGPAQGCGLGSRTHAPCGGSQTLDIFDTPGAQRGTIIFVHGGGFAGGDKVDGMGMGPLLRMRERGWDVVSVNYRLANIRTGANLFPTAVRDVDAAMDWIRTQGPANGLNPSRLVVIGESAGGTIAGLIGTAWNSGRPEFAGVERPTAYGAFAGVLTDQLPQSRFWLSQWVPNVSAGGAVASPLNHLDPADPPAWLVHGDKDSIVEAENSRRMREKAEAGKYGQLVNYDLVDVWSDNSPMPGYVRDHLPAGGVNVDALGVFLDRL